MASTAARSTVRRSAAALLAASLVALGATACNTGDSSVSTEAKKPASSAPAASGGAKQGAPAPAKVGDTIALKGFEKNGTADVTVVKIVDNAEGEDEFSKPADGKRFVAVQFRIKATGKAYSDAPSNSAKLLDNQGQSYDTSLYDTKAGQGFSGSVNIAPGESGLGFLTFEVPKDAVLDKVQFTLDSGMADQTGQWKLA
ncbi:DUF4352 domain-containing protein [Kitasatospora sp. NPDC051914]|uniref:DUF4352 domain-containing protein n=1 Tax=Kitasatospora sp. NPDC051914 TaxID=3154945 RepID=UPI0034416144